MTEQEKRTLFETLRDQDYVLTKDQSAREIVDLALSELGNTDPYMRDNLAVETAAYMIYKDYLTKEELKHLTKKLLSSDYLFYGLKAKREDSVFKRTFTSLIIAMVFRIPDKPIVLSKDELNTLYETYLVYLKEEDDYRGYIEEKGWAHFFAHSSDVMKYFFQEPSFNDTWVRRYLDTVLAIIHNPHYAFHHNEDERFTKAFIQLLERDDIEERILIDFLNKAVTYERTKAFPDDIHRFVNVKNVLREIYFSLDETNSKMKGILKKLIKTLTVNG